MKIVKFNDGKYGIRRWSWFYFEYVFFDFSADLSSLQHNDRLSNKYWMLSSAYPAELLAVHTHADITDVLGVIDKMRRSNNTDYGTVVSPDDVPFVKTEPTFDSARE